MARSTIRVPDRGAAGYPGRLPVRGEHGRWRGDARAQAVAGRLLCGVRHGDRRLCGATRGEAVDVFDERLAPARSLEATHTISAKNPQLVDEGESDV